MSGVLHLCDVLQFVIDCLYNCPLYEQHSVQHRHQRPLHVVLQLGNELYSVHKEFPEELLADVSFVTDKFAVKEFIECLILQWLPVIHISRRNHEVKQFALLVADEVELEAEEPAHRALPSLGDALEDLVNVYALVLAHTQRRAVHETDASAFAQKHPLDKDNKWDDCLLLQFHEAVVRDNLRE